jgi:hypothetical protein
MILLYLLSFYSFFLPSIAWLLLFSSNAPLFSLRIASFLGFLYYFTRGAGFALFSSHFLPPFIAPPLFFFVSALLPIVNYCVLLRSVTRLFDLNSLAGSRADVRPPLPLRFFSWFNRPRFLSHYDLFFRREVGVGAGSLASVLVFFLPTILSPPPLPPSIRQAW